MSDDRRARLLQTTVLLMPRSPNPLVICVVTLSAACSLIVPGPDEFTYARPDDAGMVDSGSTDSGVDGGEREDAGSTAACGDGDVDPGEDCDDGNLFTGDGCSGACVDEATRCEPGLVGADNDRSVGRLAIDGDRLFTAPFNSNPSVIRVLDVSSPSAPRELSAFRLDSSEYPEWRTRGVAVHGGHVWTAGRNPDLLAVDVQTPTAPTLAFALSPNRSDGELAIVGDALYLAYSISERARIYDVSVPGRASQLGEFGSPSRLFTSVAGHADMAIAATPTGHVEIWDSGVPSAPAFIGAVDLPTDAGGVRRLVADGSLIVMATASGAHLVDYSLRSAPQFVGTIAAGEDIPDTALSGAYAYLPVDLGLEVWDVSTPASPRLAGSYLEVDAFSSAVAVSGSYAYVSTANGLRIIGGLPGLCEAVCGNAFREYPEDCDDGNLVEEDGCHECRDSP